jgi:hypothetical protein
MNKASSQAMSDRSVVEDGQDRDTSRPQMPPHAYSHANYANPMKASEAKRNEKVVPPSTLKKVFTLKELPQPLSLPGTAMQPQRPASGLGGR